MDEEDWQFLKRFLLAVMGPMLPMLARRYRAFETQRMAARDRADAL